MEFCIYPKIVFQRERKAALKGILLQQKPECRATPSYAARFSLLYQSAGMLLLKAVPHCRS
ncbi:hypothetical protein CSA37_05595 [Candidatus Fermentibacteria bacterium]|nr:MAG: hypothetical protein CSA37_05595 [Candidatus Fermentibacteria bacterium]